MAGSWGGHHWGVTTGINILCPDNDVVCHPDTNKYNHAVFQYAEISNWAQLGTQVVQRSWWAEQKRPGRENRNWFFFGCATLLTTMKTRLHSANLTSEAHGDQSWAFLPQKDFLAFKDVYLSQEYRKHLLHSRQPGSLQGLIKISEGLMSNGRH